MNNKKKYFDYRCVMGGWINDIGSVPKIEQWPSTNFDATVEREIIEFFGKMKDLRYNYIEFFGLFVEHWESDFSKNISPQRDKIVRRMLAEAHKHNIKVLYVLGVYSLWFETIVRENPNVRGTHPNVICASKEASHQVMENFVDFLLSNYPFDGFHLESGDQGMRCNCDQCDQKDDLTYHVEVNKRMAQYVRTNWPDKIIEVYTPGVNKSKEDWLQWKDASQYFDFIIDGDIFKSQADVAYLFGCDSRKEIISALDCTYATRSGQWVWTPQRWRRDRWFLPLVAKRAKHYREAAEDGVRAMMIDCYPLVNVGDEATFIASAKLLEDPFRDVPSVLVETMDEMFAPKTSSICQELADLFWYAEKAYFANALCQENFEILLEPLFGKKPGPPTYLQARMYLSGLQEYKRSIIDIRSRLSRVKDEVGNKEKALRMDKSLSLVLQDIEMTVEDKKFLKYPATALDERNYTDVFIIER